MGVLPTYMYVYQGMPGALGKGIRSQGTGLTEGTLWVPVIKFRPSEKAESLSSNYFYCF